MIFRRRRNCKNCYRCSNCSSNCNFSSRVCRLPYHRNNEHLAGWTNNSVVCVFLAEACNWILAQVIQSLGSKLPEMQDS